MKEAIIYHIADKFDWDRSTTSYTHPSLDKEGFIHCSAGSQLSETFARYYKNSANLVLLEIDSMAVGDNLKWELAESRGEEFPHIFCPINRSWVIDAYPLTAELLTNISKKFGK